MIYDGDEDSNPPSVASKDYLLEINPIDHALVFTRTENLWWEFDYTSNKETSEYVLESGKFGYDHPTHAGLPFMTGRWIARL